MYSYTKKSGVQKHSVQGFCISSCLGYIFWLFNLDLCSSITLIFIYLILVPVFVQIIIVFLRDINWSNLSCTHTIQITE